MCSFEKNRYSVCVSADIQLYKVDIKKKHQIRLNLNLQRNRKQRSQNGIWTIQCAVGRRHSRWFGNGIPGNNIEGLFQIFAIKTWSLFENILNWRIKNVCQQKCLLSNMIDTVSFHFNQIGKVELSHRF